MNFRKRVVTLLLLMVVSTDYSLATWDGEPSLDDIDFNLENFLDINSYQFRRSEELDWYEVENGFRISGGSLETNILYLATDLRLKREITPNFNFRLRLVDEEFYEPREFSRPLLELELQPTAWPLTLSLIGVPAFAKRNSDLGFAATLGERPMNFLHIAWLSADHYFNDKNEIDSSFYRREPDQFTIDTVWHWQERYTFHMQLQDNEPLEFVLDDQIALFAHENQNYQLHFDYRTEKGRHFGLKTRGFETSQSLDDNVSSRSQDIRYHSLDVYWIRSSGLLTEWTVGLRYDDFVNTERTPSDATTSFDFSQQTTQIYTTYYRPFRTQQAWELGLHLGHASQEKNFMDASITDSSEDRIEAKLRTGWELFSLDQATALTMALSFNLDEIDSDVFDGGSMRLRTRF